MFVIVEGPSDDEALSVLLNRMYDKNTVHVHITHGDVTTKRGTGSSTILALLGEIIETYMNANHLAKTHFQEIVHIVDMDGAYIPDDAVAKDVTVKKTLYSLMEIRTANVREIIDRNMTKRGCIDKITSTKKLFGVPYQAYFMSCNLDHVLYNKRNSSDEEKERDSLYFARRYRSDFRNLCNSYPNPLSQLGEPIWNPGLSSRKEGIHLNGTPT